jgi:hypothetical protein
MADRSTAKTSPRQQVPLGFFTSQAQWPAFTSAAMIADALLRPVLVTSPRMVKGV